MIFAACPKGEEREGKKEKKKQFGRVTDRDEGGGKGKKKRLSNPTFSRPHIEEKGKFSDCL